MEFDADGNKGGRPRSRQAQQLRVAPKTPAGVMAGVAASNVYLSPCGGFGRGRTDGRGGRDDRTTYLAASGKKVDSS